MKEMYNAYRIPAALLIGFLTVIVGFATLIGLADPFADFASPRSHGSVSGDMSPIKDVLLHPSNVSILRPDQIDSETLWLARAIFSETKRPEEQLLVAWVIRNRVESGYRGRKTYRTVVLDPYQFSAFRTDTAQRAFYSGLNANSDMPGWETALRIAFDVRHLDVKYRPFSELTRHFYSARSMKSKRGPAWANGQASVDVNRFSRIDESRFKFFAGIS